MNRITTLLAATLVAAGAGTLAFAHEGEHAEGEGHDETVTITGELIDTACYVSSDGGAKGKGHAECAQKCLASGIPAAVLPDGGETDSILFLLTNPKVLAQYAAQTIKVEGVRHENMQSVDVKKVSVKQADGSFKEIELKDEHHKMAGGDDHADNGHGDHKH